MLSSVGARFGAIPIVLVHGETALWLFAVRLPFCWSTAASGTNGLWHNINPVLDGFKELVPPKGSAKKQGNCKRSAHNAIITHTLATPTTLTSWLILGYFNQRARLVQAS